MLQNSLGSHSIEDHQTPADPWRNSSRKQEVIFVIDPVMNAPNFWQKKGVKPTDSTPL
ncbi:MAG: hypothetical protein ACU83N_07905 [Gammaproteobacteria bacterium]